MSRKLTDDEVSLVTSITDDDITKELFILWFGRDAKTGESKFQPNDWFMLKPGTLKCVKSKEPIKTTVGRYIYNVFLNDSVFGGYFDYFNGSKEADFDAQVIDAFMEEKFPAKLNTVYQTKKCWLQFTPEEIIIPGLSFNMMTPRPEVEKRKKELYKQYKKELDAGDPVISKKVEDELLAIAEQATKDDPAQRLYKCGKPTWGNNYKHMCVMSGAIKDNDSEGYHVSVASYSDGIPKDEYDSYADELIGGVYSRSVATAVGGYLVKKTQSAMQNETCNTDRNSDCGTPYTMKITLTKNTYKLYLYRFIKEGNKYIELTPSVIKNYIGKTVDMRSLLFCRGKSYCAKCAGTLYARLGVKNAGLTCSDAPNKLLNTSMKAFHDPTIKSTEIEFEKYFSDF